jgi:hypothetical protein
MSFGGIEAYDLEGMMAHRGGWWPLRRMAVGALPILTAIAFGIAPAISQAAEPIKTTTTVDVTSVDSSGNVTFTATVSAVDPLSGRGGPITFTDTSNGNSGAAPLTPGVCTNKTCQATITEPSTWFAAGDNVIVASYPGGQPFAPSSATTDLPQTVTCAPGFCSADSISGDQTAELNVQQFNTTGANDVIVLGFDTTPLPCSTPNTGDTVVWSTSDTVDGKTLVYNTFGTAADNAQAAHPIDNATGTGGYVCFRSAIEFTTVDGTPATQLPDGTFAGQLPACAAEGDAAVAANQAVAGSPPCVATASFTTDTDFGDQYSTTVDAPPGDPWMSH